MANDYVPPSFGKKAFHCPFCNVYAHQEWRSAIYSRDFFIADEYGGHYRISKCHSCQNNAIWNSREKMIYPLISSAPKPSKDMPNDVKEVYEEARQVSVYSPRAAAALLRVALEKLTAHLGETTGNLNTRIGKLKAKGLPDKVIDSLDIVRISANEGGSHAGTIDLTGEDNQKIVNKLFSLVNFIVERTITDINVVNEMFDQLPEAKKEGIKNRDKQ